MLGTKIIVSGEFNCRWTTGSINTYSKARTETLRSFAAQFDLCKVFSTVHPNITPTTFIASEEPGARRSWIDYVFASTQLLSDGHILEAGILMHETLNRSDHRAYMFEINLDQALQIGPEWSMQPHTDRKLAKININSDKQVSQFQQRVAKQCTYLKAYNIQSQAVEAVRKWQLQQVDDASTLRAIELLYDLSIVLVVGS